MKSVLLSLSLLLSVALCIAQKKPLDHSVYDSWQHIGERMISNDGKWVVYTIDPQEGNNELVIQSSDAKYRKSVPRGYSAVITEDSRYVVFKIKPFYSDTREARIKKKKADDMPKDSIAIVELGKEEIRKTAKVKSYKTPQKSAGWVAYQLEKMPEPPAKPKTPDSNRKSNVSDSLNHIIDSLQSIIKAIPERKKRTRADGTEEELEDTQDIFGQDADGDEPAGSAADAGSDLVVRKLVTGEEKIFANVLEYYFSKTGDKLLLEQAKNPKDSLSKTKVLLYDLKEARTTVLSNGGNDFKNFTMTDDGSQIAFLAERDARPKELQRFYRIWYYKAGMDSASLLADKNTVDMHLGMGISEFGNLNFSKNGKRLFFGTAPIQPPKDTSIVEIDKPKVDIWHYNDDYLQTVQLIPARLRAAQQENFLAMVDLAKKTITQLGSKEIPQVIQTNEGDGEIFVGVTDIGKRIQSQWVGTTEKDIYAIDVSSGEKQIIKENLLGQIYPSSTGKYIMWYDRKAKHYFAWDGATVKNITAKIKVPLYAEDWDTPSEPNNYGVMKWQENDEAVLIYDRYGVWKIDPASNQTPLNIIGGRDKKIQYRYIQADADEKYIKKGQQLVFQTLNEVNKKAGVWRGLYSGDNSINKQLLPIHSDDSYSFAQVIKSKNSDDYIFTKESFKESPDLYYWHQTEEGPDGNKLSSINPQQNDYNWGTAELFNWKAYNGKDATGLVYKPEDFDPKKKYPMIVYFYEKLSDNLYDYKEPAPIRSAINVPFFVSRGYIIFMPDITYKTGYPGKSAYDYIVSGARALVKKGFVDSTNMALQGHSWGGYQAAQVATMTKLFKAIWAGAPVANMTSAYGGIRWESGVARQFQYEKTQSRIGGTLWEKLPLYLENSPLFHLNKVTAPMVIMANDADGAVPWYQGIELFTGLRRLGKKTWMFNYNGQGHGLTQRQDMRDYQIRMQQFFDWILKGDKPAKWITEGVPAVKKGKEWGLELVD
ncbi:MAG: prolyl oligopeptidase family serine peptidase [Chitinophagaceae bacterium]|nr:S9 family peptidase [Chitinophagaceae bacterium]MBK9464559.1 S9 family peptidase [Chitinophagaceae bacterium]MBK9660085.1 S9 family peptidase [Chitinophagaceae bacterium]